MVPINRLSYIEDKNLLAYCTEKRDYKIISDYINNNKEILDFKIEEYKSLIGYKINKINQLTEIYEQDFYSVNFFFENITHEFNEEDNLKIGSLIQHFANQLSEKKGYYIIKVPSSNTMLINQINKLHQKYIFAGGTVCYYTKKIIEKEFKQDGLIIKLASKKDKEKYREELLKLGRKSFEKYFGQYHISYITREKAPLIYENWVNDYLENNDGYLLVAFYQDKLCGFLTLDETDHSLEMVLSGVDENFRGLKIYERMIREGVKLALNKNKLSTLSTQFDNYFVQRAWINIGFKPYYSFYLYHFNNLF